MQALRKTVETREKGILYEHPAEDARAQGLAHELGELFEAKDAEGRTHAPADRDLAEALSRLERAVDGHAAARGNPATRSSTPRRASPPGSARRPGRGPRSSLIVEP